MNQKEFIKITTTGSVLAKAGVEGTQTGVQYIPLKELVINLGTNVRREARVYARAEDEDYQNQFLTNGVITPLQVKITKDEVTDSWVFQTLDHTRPTALRYLRNRILAKGFDKPDTMALWDSRSDDFWVPIQQAPETVSESSTNEIAYQLILNSGEKLDDMSLLLLAQKLVNTENPDTGKNYTQQQVADVFTTAGYPTKRETVAYWLDAAKIPRLGDLVDNGSLPDNVQILKTIGKGIKKVWAWDEAEDHAALIDELVDSIVRTLEVMESRNIRATAANVQIAVDNWLINKGIIEGKKEDPKGGEALDFGDGEENGDGDPSPGPKVKVKELKAEESLVQFLAKASSNTTWGSKTIKVSEIASFLLSHFNSGLDPDTYAADLRAMLND